MFEVDFKGMPGMLIGSEKDRLVGFDVIIVSILTSTLYAQIKFVDNWPSYRVHAEHPIPDLVLLSC